MAHRVMLRFHAGLAGRRETKSDGGKALMDGLRLLFEGWRDSGIRLIVRSPVGNISHVAAIVFSFP